MRELLVDEKTSAEIEVKYYYVQWYSNNQKKWLNIGGSDPIMWLKSYEYGQMTACGDCWQRYGFHGILDKEYAIKFVKDLREAIKTNSDDLGYSKYLTLDEIGGIRLCKCKYKKKCKVIDI